METIYRIEEETAFDEMVHILKGMSEREQESVRDVLRGFQLARRYVEKTAHEDVQGTA
ncbi:hypothetical protein [Sporosarcina sp. FSL K6-1508]|uniref:hypothetical protein n=1 Tax=Sporosarcina sp. FSL K6-1508 TaxID=2921553 RepID=UPI0030F5F49F